VGESVEGPALGDWARGCRGKTAEYGVMAAESGSCAGAEGGGERGEDCVRGFVAGDADAEGDSMGGGEWDCVWGRKGAVEEGGRIADAERGCL
jgi:hypothetical protein